MVFMDFQGYVFGLGGALLACAALLMWFALRVVRRWEHRYRDPFLNSPLLRPPGHGCLMRREKLTEELSDQFVYIACFYGFGLGLATAKGYSLWACVIAAVLLLGATLYFGLKAQRLLNACRKARLGYLGELAVAEALSKLPHTEWRVFHDVPMTGENGQDFNLDHVVLGPPGVFVIETKTWSKFRRRMVNGYRLLVNGDRVEFPDLHRSESPLKQAQANAAALAAWLEAETGEKPWVHAQVVTPGWAVKYSGPPNKLICEIACLRVFLEQTPGELSPHQRGVFSAALDSKCREMTFEKPGNFLSAHQTHHSPSPAKGKRKKKVAVTY